MFKRLISCLTLALFTTACTGVDVQRGGNLLEHEPALDNAIATAAVLLEENNSLAGSAEAVGSNAGTVITTVGVLALVGGLAYLVSSGGDVGDYKSKPFKHESNVD